MRIQDGLKSPVSSAKSLVTGNRNSLGSKYSQVRDSLGPNLKGTLFLQASKVTFAIEEDDPQSVTLEAEP